MAMLAFQVSYAIEAELVLVSSSDLTAHVSTENSGRLASAAINGTGLTNGAHSITNGQMWSSQGLLPDLNYQYFIIELSQAKDIDSMHIWNGNWGSTYKNRGVKYYDIYYAQSTPTLSLVDFTNASEWAFLRSDSLDEASGTASYTGEGKSLKDIPSNITCIALKINNTYADALAYTMLSEIQLYELESTEEEVLPLVASVTAPKTMVSGDVVDISFALQGVAPWDLTYSLNGSETTVNAITTSPYTLQATLAENTLVKINSVSDANETKVNADSTSITVYETVLNPALDGMVRQHTTDLFTLAYIELKDHSTSSREGVFSFDIRDLDSMEQAVFQVYLYSPTTFSDQNLHIYGISQTEYDGKVTTWDNIQSYSHIDSGISVDISTADLNQYVTFDVSSYLNKCIADNDTIMNLLLKASSGSDLFKIKMTENNSNMPQLMYTEYDDGIATVLDGLDTKAAQVSLYPNPVVDQLNVEASFDVSEAAIYNLQGQLVMSTHVEGGAISLSALKAGNYIVKLAGENQISCKIITKR